MDEQNNRLYLFDDAMRGYVRCWDLNDGAELGSVPIKLESTTCVAIKNDGEEVAFIAKRANEPGSDIAFATARARSGDLLKSPKIAMDAMIRCRF